MPVMHNNSLYKAGGSLAWDDSTYVSRQADEDLYGKVRQGRFCYVLGPHQTGKSSLRIRARHRLEKRGYLCATVQATQLCKDSQDDWDKPLISSIWDSLHPSDTTTIASWLEATAKLPSWRRLEHFTRDLLFPELREKPLVIFIDEIDYFLDLPLAIHALFSWIEKSCSLQKKRSEYKPLSFVVLGSTTVASLKQAVLRVEQSKSAEKSEYSNDTHSPLRRLFSVAGAVALNNFELEQTRPLQQGIADQLNPVEAVSAVLRWTDGQPFLTQKLCKILTEQIAPKISLNSTADLNRWVDTLVNVHILQDWQHQDDPVHLRVIRDRLHYSPDFILLRKLYQQISLGQRVSYSGTQIQKELLMIGLVRCHNQQLCVANQIYRHVFSAQSISPAPKFPPSHAYRRSLAQKFLPKPSEKSSQNEFYKGHNRQQVYGLLADSPEVFQPFSAFFNHPTKSRSTARMLPS